MLKYIVVSTVHVFRFSLQILLDTKMFMPKYLLFRTSYLKPSKLSYTKKSVDAILVTEADNFQALLILNSVVVLLS